jgi:phosphatidylserine/phosphatidylglycerophosphate/cardiolipin synthase-like enzyme
MSAQPAITTPLALNCTRSATLTLPWFVRNTEYYPVPATFLPLVNGEKAFGDLYDAIQAAQHTVEIVCWGFQPSMYFKRDGSNTLPIGELLAAAGARGVVVRILCWADPTTLAAFNENMMPGNNLESLIYKQNENESQREYDQAWYFRALGHADERGQPQNIPNVHVATRDFNLIERVEIAYRQFISARHEGRSQENTAIITAFPTHHQKMVLIDYETPAQAVGYVMGHNMLDAYWDRDNHSALRMHARLGRNGATPRQDISSRVTGPVLEHLNLNFCRAWQKETGEDLLTARKPLAKQLQPRRDKGAPSMVQILRTQSQEGKNGIADIRKLYLQAANNITSFVYIENQYFRYTDLAVALKTAAQAHAAGGRKDMAYLFVVTNTSQEAMGSGALNTYRMLDALGRDDTMPAVARKERDDTLSTQLSAAQQQETSANMEMLNSDAAQENPAAVQQEYAAAKAKEVAIRQQMKDNEDPKKDILPSDIPGLKVHICTLVAPDSAPDNWMEVYVHAKLMIVNDTFTTLGSANINARSMEVDSELNICHAEEAVTKPLRQQLWNLHTNGVGAQADPAEAFKQWDRLIKRNSKFKTNKQAPYASLTGFMRTSPSRTDED